MLDAGRTHSCVPGPPVCAVTGEILYSHHPLILSTIGVLYNLFVLDLLYNAFDHAPSSNHVAFGGQTGGCVRESSRHKSESPIGGGGVRCPRRSRPPPPCKAPYLWTQTEALSRARHSGPVCLKAGKGGRVGHWGAAQGDSHDSSGWRGVGVRGCRTSEEGVDTGRGTTEGHRKAEDSRACCHPSARTPVFQELQAVGWGLSGHRPPPP